MSELPLSIANSITYFSGRTWLLPVLQDWLEHSGERVFLLTGGPGTGKSMIAAWLAGAGPAPEDPGARSLLEAIRARVAAVHFSISASRNTSPRAAAETISSQLTQNVKQFGEALAAILAERVQIIVNQQVGSLSGGSVTGVAIGRLDLGSLDDETSFDRAFTQPLKKLYASGYDQTMVLIFDGLDEAQTYPGSANLVQILSGLADLPRQVRFVLTSRSDPRVLKYFRDVPGKDLTAGETAGLEDVRLYVERRLEDGAPGLAKELRLQAAARIGAAAKGVFLYGQMVAEDLLARPAAIPDLENYPLPEGLSRLYQNFINRELGRDEDRWDKLYRPLLGLIAVSREPGLTRTQLGSVLGSEVDQPLRACKQYLAGDLPEGPFRLFDRSFSDFLLKDAENWDYHVDSAKMNRCISDYYVKNFSQDWPACDSYGLNHVVEHTLSGGMNAEERKAVFDRILTDEYVNAIQARNGWLYAFIEDLEALAGEEPNWAAKVCFTLILDRPPNSLVLQHALRLLVKLRPATGPVGMPGAPREASLDAVVEIFCDQAGNIAGRLKERLDRETDARVRGVIALALAESKEAAAAAWLLEILKEEFGEVSWAAADALIALNQRDVIAGLCAWYEELKDRRDRRSSARKERILYVLGWMHAEEARGLEANARAASDPKIVGRALDLTWLLQPRPEDAGYLRDQLRRILASPPQQPKLLGPFSDAWAEKRLVRAI